MTNPTADSGNTTGDSIIVTADEGASGSAGAGTLLRTWPMPANQPAPYWEQYAWAASTRTFSIDWEGILERRWRADYPQAIADAVRPTEANGFQYRCTTAGETSAYEPSWPSVNGATVNDGSVVWTCEATDNNGLIATVSSAQWSIPSALTSSGATFADQLTQITLDAAAVVAAADYDVECTVGLSDGESLVAVLKLMVRVAA